MCCCRATREEKERRKRWAQRKTSSKPDKRAQREVEAEEIKQDEENQETRTIPGMLPSNVIEMLAAREKYVHLFPPLYQLLKYLFSHMDLKWLYLFVSPFRQTFKSDSEEENVKQEVQKKKKKMKTTGYFHVPVI